MNKKIGILTLLCLFLINQSLWAQKKHKSEDVETLVAEANREIPPAYRIAEMPKIIDTVEKYEVTNYSLLSLKYNTAIHVDTIKAANVVLKDKLTQLYNTYVRVGFGYPLIPVADVYFNNRRNRKYIYGVSANHVSTWLNKKNYAPSTFDRTKGKLYGGILNDKWTLKGDINANYRGLKYYGIRDESVSKDTILQRYNELGLNGRFESRVKDSANLNYSIDLSYKNLYDRIPRVDSLKKWHAMENYIAIAPKFHYKWTDFTFGLDVDAKYNGYRYGIADTTKTPTDSLDTGIVVNNFIFEFQPYAATSFFDNRLKVKAGVNLTYDAGIINKFRVYPSINVEFNPKSGTFNPYLRLDGKVTQNSFREMSYVNEFILSNQQLRNTTNTINAAIGVRGSITSQIGYNVQAEFGMHKDYLFFVNDTIYSPAKNKFRAIYDSVNIAKVEASMFYQLNEKIKIDVIGRYFSYMMKNEVFAWNMPDYEILFRGSYNLYDKFLVSLTFDIQGGRKAKVYEQLDASTIEEEGIFAQKLGLIYDIDLHMEYRYSPRLSFFVDLNNVAANQYNRWLNYPVYGIQALAGATFRF